MSGEEKNEAKQQLKPQKILGSYNNCSVYMGVAEIIEAITLLAGKDKTVDGEQKLKSINAYKTNYEDLKDIFGEFYGRKNLTWEQLYTLLVAKTQDNTAAQQIILGPVLRGVMRKFATEGNLSAKAISHLGDLQPALTKEEEKQLEAKQPLLPGRAPGRYDILGADETAANLFKYLAIRVVSHSQEGKEEDLGEIEFLDPPFTEIHVFNKQGAYPHWERGPEIDHADINKLNSDPYYANLSDANIGESLDQLATFKQYVNNFFNSPMPANVVIPVPGLAVKHYEPIKNLFKSYNGYTSKITENKGVLDVYLKPVVEEKTTLNKKEDIHLTYTQGTVTCHEWNLESVTAVLASLRAAGLSCLDLSDLSDKQFEQFNTWKDALTKKGAEFDGFKLECLRDVQEEKPVHRISPSR